MSDYHSDYQTAQIALKYVPAAQLRELAHAILATTALRAEDAAIVADALWTSELRNLQGQGQGVRRVKAYVERVGQGLIDPHAPFELVKESPAMALIDAHNAPGTMVAVKAMRIAVAKAKVCGVGVAMVRHSTHFGSASYSAAEALKHGCIGVSLTNAGPEMAPWGGIDGVVGTNPWAIAVPSGDTADDMPIILDMALTMAGKGMMGWLMRDGKKMPRTWAITKDGRETDEPAEAMDGTLLPMGDYKGYGLSFMTDVLTGVLGGSAFGTVPYSIPNRQDVGHQFIAYDIEWFMERPQFYGRMHEFMAMVRASRPRPGVSEILLPGELEWRRQQQKLQAGVPLDPIIYDELRTLAADCGVAWPFGE
jgi:LDH2 family malate/lactate/ureidoglycolate dehydrogenase